MHNLGNNYYIIIPCLDLFGDLACFDISIRSSSVHLVENKEGKG